MHTDTQETQLRQLSLGTEIFPIKWKQKDRRKIKTKKSAKRQKKTHPKNNTERKELWIEIQIVSETNYANVHIKNCVGRDSCKLYNVAVTFWSWATNPK